MTPYEIASLAAQLASLQEEPNKSWNELIQDAIDLWSLSDRALTMKRGGDVPPGI